MILRVFNTNNSYDTPSIEDFKLGKVKVYYLANSNDTLNPYLKNCTLSSECNHIWWSRHTYHFSNYPEYEDSVLINYLKQGRIRVKKENQMEQDKIKVIPPIYTQYFVEDYIHKGNVYLVKLEHSMPEKVFNPRVKVFLDSILEIAGVNELSSLVDLLDYEMHPDGKSVRDTLEDLSYTIGERLELIDFQVMKVPFASEKFVTSTLNPISKSAVGIFYTYKEDGIKAEAVVENVMRDILSYHPLCIKKEQLLPSIVKIEEKKGTLDKFLTDKVLLNNKALFEKEQRSIEEILKEAQIEILDFIYI